MTATKKVEMAKLEVVLPVVKIRLQDLSCLRGLVEAESDPDKVCCVIPGSVESRLRILGLVTDVIVPPCARAMKKWEDNREQVRLQIVKIASKSPMNFNDLQKVDTYHCRDSNKPQERKVMRVTAEGRKLLGAGSVKVEIKKSCR